MFVGRLPHERGVARREIERLALFLGPGSGKIASAGDLDGFFRRGAGRFPGGGGE